MAKTPLKAIAVIPARGGSKRLPRKALLPFNGKPMICHTIEAAQAAACFDRIVVSSDDDEILSVAAKTGCTAYRRNDDLAGDEIPTAPVLLDVLEHEKTQQSNWDIISCLYATAPLRTSADIESVMDLIEPGVCDFAMAVCESDRPIHQTLSLTDTGLLNPVWPDTLELNSQDAPRYFFGNGSTYCASVQPFQEHQTLYGPGLKGYVMPRSRSVDLDTEEDLALLEFYASQSNAS